MSGVGVRIAAVLAEFGQMCQQPNGKVTRQDFVLCLVWFKIYVGVT
jgi:hypothetical protein